MKKTTIFKIWGIIQLIIGIALLFLGFSDKDSFDMPNISLIYPGFLLIGLSLMILSVGFSPEVAKLKSKIEAETIDHAGKDISEAKRKGAETVIPAVTPELKRAYKTIKDEKTIEEKLSEAQRLLDNKIITNEEYDQMRKRILGID
jgi:hypothetical protein